MILFFLEEPNYWVFEVSWFLAVSFLLSILFSNESPNADALDFVLSQTSAAFSPILLPRLSNLFSVFSLADSVQADKIINTETKRMKRFIIIC